MKFLGYLLIALPFIVLTIIMIKESGIQAASIVWGLVASILIASILIYIWVGIYLSGIGS